MTEGMHRIIPICGNLRICEKLRTTHRVTYGTPREWPINPDGPQAADLIQELHDALFGVVENTPIVDLKSDFMQRAIKAVGKARDAR